MEIHPSCVKRKTLKKKKKKQQTYRKMDENNPSCVFGKSCKKAAKTQLVPAITCNFRSQKIH